MSVTVFSIFFFFNDSATTEIYTLPYTTLFRSRSAGPRASSTVDVLDRVLDKGLSITGDIRISLAEIELLTMRIRMIMCSDRKSTRLNSSHSQISYAVFCLKKKQNLLLLYSSTT